MARTLRRFEVVQDGLTFEFEEAEEGGYTVTVPDLPGCISEGDTFEEALDMIKDALHSYLIVAQEFDDPIPAPYRALTQQLKNSS
jgi:predicted RNase H-like HicB family nuclease